jgi:cytochrome c-type biogenesis protein CcmH/NrfG
VQEPARTPGVREAVATAPIAGGPPPEPIAEAVAKPDALVQPEAATPLATVKYTPIAKPANAKSADRQSLRAAGNRLKHVPSSALAKLRRGDAGLSKGLARELTAGTRALERGKAYTAYSHFLRASQLAPRSADALMGIALCHYELDQRGATRRALAKVFALEASHPEASILSGFIAQLAGKPAAAVEWYRRALGGVEETEVADELRSVIAQLEPADSTPTATALAK